MMNGTINATLEYGNHQLTLNAIPNIIVTFVYLVFGLTGNSFVIYVYAFATRGNINNKYFILVLAIVDIISCVVNCIFTIVLDLMQLNFTSEPFCKVLRVLCHVTALTSAFILLVIAIQRYQLVCRPLGRQMTPFVQKVFVFLSVLMSAILGFPAIEFYGVADVTRLGYRGTACKYKEEYVDSKELLIYNGVFMLSCITGIISVCVLYFMVVVKIYRQRKRFPTKNRSINKDRQTTEFSTTDSETQSDNRLDSSLNDGLMEKMVNRKTSKCDLTTASDVNLQEKGTTSSSSRTLPRKASQSSLATFSVRGKTKKIRETLKTHRFSLMFVAITIVCVISFIPLRSLELMEVSDNHFVERTFGNALPLYRFLYTSYIINNIANPLIYGLFDKQFRKRLRGLFSR